MKTIAKFLGFGLILVTLGAAILFGSQYLKYRKSPEYQAVQDIKNLEQQYRDDPYGGSTPEETLQLFIDALKKGDIELASKYFLIEEQEQWKEDLGKTVDRGLVEEMIRDLGKAKLTIDGETAFYTLTGEDGIDSELVMHKNPLNNRWKITEL